MSSDRIYGYIGLVTRNGDIKSYVALKNSIEWVGDKLPSRIRIHEPGILDKHLEIYLRIEDGEKQVAVRALGKGCKHNGIDLPIRQPKTLEQDDDLQVFGRHLRFVFNPVLNNKLSADNAATPASKAPVAANQAKNEETQTKKTAAQKKTSSKTAQSSSNSKSQNISHEPETDISVNESAYHDFSQISETSNMSIDDFAEMPVPKKSNLSQSRESKASVPVVVQEPIKTSNEPKPSSTVTASPNAPLESENAVKSNAKDTETNTSDLKEDDEKKDSSEKSEKPTRKSKKNSSLDQLLAEKQYLEEKEKKRLARLEKTPTATPTTTTRSGRAVRGLLPSPTESKSTSSIKNSVSPKKISKPPTKKTLDWSSSSEEESPERPKKSSLKSPSSEKQSTKKKISDEDYSYTPTKLPNSSAAKAESKKRPAPDRSEDLQPAAKKPKLDPTLDALASLSHSPLGTPSKKSKFFGKSTPQKDIWSSSEQKEYANRLGGFGFSAS